MGVGKTALASSGLQMLPGDLVGIVQGTRYRGQRNMERQ